MNEKNVVSILKEQGWDCSKDEVGDYFCVTDLGGIQLQVIPSVGKRSDHFRVSLMPSISTEEFSDAVSFISGDVRNNTPIKVSNDAPEKLVNLSSDSVIKLTEKAISWARSQSIDEGLKFYKDLPTDAKGALPIRHLAALALAGDIGRLSIYKQSFDKGDRLGFAPYITTEMLSRALILGEEKKQL
ncbi:DUF6990 domain-containing protein [Pseudomonas viridiflava]|uniref:DUF6990 domain-containing protein n=1 Tax=Pseudomonas viridiflava TaxID=33069 RepID=UPI00178727B9|nr:hypothetical protein [Pseudomonas viridiflava]MBD8189834.1 hypothetical protein [Pseudomonas viridiflava]MBD8204645.1 hypothetical protein [Pseudomonas viridiflava]